MSQLAKIDQQLAQAKSVKELFTFQMVKERFIKNYEAVSGNKDGENVYEQERFAYLEVLAEKPELQGVDKFYHFAAIVKAGTTGLSFRDKSLYLMPIMKGGQVTGIKVDSSPAGKRKEMEMMPDVKKFPEAILVMYGDNFIHDKLNNVVIKHESTDKTKEDMKLENIRAAYQRIYYNDNTIIDVVVYHDDLVKAKSKSKMRSEEGLWNAWPGEACKKTATNRAYNRYHKYPKGIVVYDVKEEESDTNDADYSDITPTQGIDTSTGEVLTPEVKVEKQSPLPTKEEGESFM